MNTKQFTKASHWKKAETSGKFVLHIFLLDNIYRENKGHAFIYTLLY